MTLASERVGVKIEVDPADIGPPGPGEIPPAAEAAPTPPAVAAAPPAAAGGFAALIAAFGLLMLELSAYFALVQIPVLLSRFPQTAVATLFGTNKFSSIFGTASAARSFTQTDLLEGMSYYYSVVPVGGVAALGIAADACTGPVSDCAAAGTASITTKA